jgi:membrane protein DedA with SNARE-associated domain
MFSATRLTIVILLAMLIPIVPFLVIGELPGERWLSAADENAFLFGAIGSALLAADVLLPIPSSIVGTMLGARLGVLPGWLWGWAGLVLGNIIGYATGQLLLSRMKTQLPESPTLLILFLSRPVPVLAEAVTFTCGAARMNLAHFLIASIAGNGAYSFALSANGASLLPDSFMGPGLILPLLLPVLAWVVWRWLARKKNAVQTS